MASCSKRDNNGSLFTPKKTHFIRIILSDIMKNQKIAIPRRFLRKHGESLSKSAVIKVPSAATWKVELLKHKDEVSFAKGWEMFIAYYSIDYGDFLVFEYEGNSLFTVFIIDKSFTEVGYQWNNTDAAESNQEDKLEDHEDDDDDASVEFIDISSGSQETGKGTKGKEKLGCSRNSEEYEGDHGGRPTENKCHPSGTPLLCKLILYLTIDLTFPMTIKELGSKKIWNVSSIECLQINNLLQDEKNNEHRFS